MEEDEAACKDEFVMGIGAEKYCADRKLDDRPREKPSKLRIFFPIDPEKKGRLDQEPDKTPSSAINSNFDEEVGGRIDFYCKEGKKKTKKLRLSDQQSALLESSFNEHTMITSAQKKELADLSHLSARQVEVWFQNRRARTKTKQMEKECEFLKNCCARLSVENQRLKEELTDLKFMKLENTCLSYHNVVSPRGRN